MSKNARVISLYSVLRSIYSSRNDKLKYKETQDMLSRTESGLRLHLGCGNLAMEGFFNIDFKKTRATDYICDIGELPCKDRSVTRIETYHVIEHISHTKIREYLKEWYRVMDVGGILVVECPDLDEACRKYLVGDDEMLYSIYGRQRYEGDTHYYGYNHRRLKNLLEEVGFNGITEGEPRDYHAETEPCLRVIAYK